MTFAPSFTKQKSHFAQAVPAFTPEQQERCLADLYRRFANATTGIRSTNAAGTILHRMQVDFSYVTNEIACGPVYIAPKLIDQANRLIDSVIRARREAAPGSELSFPQVQ